MRWDIAISVFVLTGVISFKIWQWWDRVRIKSPIVSPVSPPPRVTPLPTTKRVSGWVWIFLCVLFVLVVNWSGNLPHWGNNTTPAPTKVVVENPKPQPVTSASITLSKKDGWVPIRVWCEKGTVLGMNVIPQDTVVVVKKPGSPLFYDGKGYENDNHTTRISSHHEWQTWQVRTEENRPITYTVTWAN